MNEGTYLYREARKALEARAAELGRPLDAACQEAGADYGGAEGQQAQRRFLRRFGLLSPSRASKADEQRTAELISQAQDGAQATTGEVLAAWALFSGGVPGSQELAVCGEEPRCAQCPLRERCEYPNRAPTIRELPESERPRERLIQEGPDALSDAELLGIIIQAGTRKKTAVDLAKQLLSQHGSLRGISTRTVRELSETPGIGPAKAAKIQAALTIGRRMAESAAFERGEPVQTSESLFRRYHTALRDSMKEVFKVVLLDRKNRVIAEDEVSTGSLSASIVHPREVLNPAIRQSASAIICVHNHPSGDPKPSGEDVEITRRIHDASRIVGIALLDHIIIGDDRYFSFADEGIIKSWEKGR
jgi:DNA repair protein RadC